MIILDTDVCIHILRGNLSVIEQRQKYSSQAAVSFMTAAGLFYGAEKSANPLKNRTLVDQFLLTVVTVESDRRIVRRFGSLKAVLEGEGLPLADADLFIAATTLEKGDLLVTGNTKHFSRVEGLSIANWIG